MTKLCDTNHLSRRLNIPTHISNIHTILYFYLQRNANQFVSCHLYHTTIAFVFLATGLSILYVQHEKIHSKALKGLPCFSTMNGHRLSLQPTNSIVVKASHALHYYTVSVIIKMNVLNRGGGWNWKRFVQTPPSIHIILAHVHQVKIALVIGMKDICLCILLKNQRNRQIVGHLALPLVSELTLNKSRLLVK